MSNLHELINKYYHTTTVDSLFWAITDDVKASLLGMGSGLFLGLVRGMFIKLLVNRSGHVFVGRGCRLIQGSRIYLGNYVWIKDNVTLFGCSYLKIGDNSVIYERTALWSGREGLSIGRNVAVGIGCFFDAIGAKIEIGDNALISDHVRIYTVSHGYEDSKVLKRDQVGKIAPVVVAENVWIGSGAVILPGVHIGKGAVVGAGALVTQSVPAMVVVGGIPAKILKKIHV